ncbi:7-carboxy-7-deazaguanine synthase [Alkalihalobacillus xiaoxiensis]|uniref:7-carboxy-7-deazaguanine synthase n=1 Tax=Shouchella xiaoxiensis TaxID=766895 RepID=A0ABS2SZ02_9BACI|nr:7-carboxy-7-deazaguanine synthase QueE [Shouchella xiaoxiensis]MBM7840758.1 7-carboxy-7-deazaguanine synthase [Shouchella xiaoxiensis]
MVKPIPVLEVFGPTIQGEGMVIGQKTMFVRTGGCDYRCSWCDSAFTWDGTGKSEALQPEEIINRLDALAPSQYKHVTISGGNPLLHQGIAQLIEQLNERGIKTAVETQGSLWQDWLLAVDDVTISPKPPSSGMKTDWDKLDYFIDTLEPSQLSLKVVVFDEIDYAYAKDVHKRYPTTSLYLQVGNEDTTTGDQNRLLTQLLDRYEQLINWTMEDTEMNYVRVLPQLHTLLWGNKRGV